MASFAFRKTVVVAAIAVIFVGAFSIHLVEDFICLKDCFVNTKIQRYTYNLTMDETQVPLIQDRIHSIRGQTVILDSNLAELDGVTTNALNQAVARNKDRFPEYFSFILNNQEVTNLRSQIVTSSSGYGGRRYSPRVFTEHGALMASTVLRSEQATTMSLFIMRAFVKMREALATNQKILQRLAEIEKTLLSHDSALRDLYQKLRPLLSPPDTNPKPQIGFKPDPKA